MNEMRELALKLRKTADMLDELAGITKHNETPKTAKKIVKSIKRKNPWSNPKYKAKMLKHMAKMRAAKKVK